jgi:hypothetical protein
MKGISSALGWGVIWLVLIIATVGLALIPFAIVSFLTFAGGGAREQKGFDQLASTMMRDERLIVQAIQMRVFALWHRRLVIAMTNSRIIILSRGLLGGFDMKDIQWKDLTDAQIQQNILPDLCGSNLSFKHRNAGVGFMQVLGIEHDQAAEIYSYSQEEEQAWEEKRRVRDMEQARAAAGGVYVNAAQASQPAEAAMPVLTARHRPANTMLEEIERAKTLLESGVISDSEFQEMKSKIISAA